MSGRDQGERIQAEIDAIELSAASRPFGSVLLGIGLAVTVVVGGIAAFVVVLVLLVGVIR